MASPWLQQLRSRRRTLWVRELAGRMARNQAIEINEMQAARTRADLDPDPDGYEPGPFPDQGNGGEMSESDDMDHSDG